MTQSMNDSDSPNARPLTGYERVVWLGMGVDVPAEWAMVRHSLMSAKGRLVWMDRRHQRMQLSWMTCPSQPDMEQVLADYRRMDMAADDQARFEPMHDLIGWQGIRSRGKRCLTRAARYETLSHRWVEVVLEWPDEVDEAMERAVCESFAVEDGDALPRHWRAFGVDVTLAEGWELLRVDARPADVCWLFSRPRQELAVRRLGMLHTWYDQDVRGFIRRQINGQAVEFTEVSNKGHTAIMGESREPAARILQWLGRQRIRRDWVWHCQESDALWQVTTVGAERCEADAMNASVNCCELESEI